MPSIDANIRILKLIKDLTCKYASLHKNTGDPMSSTSLALFPVNLLSTVNKGKKKKKTQKKKINIRGSKLSNQRAPSGMAEETPTNSGLENITCHEPG